MNSMNDDMKDSVLLGYLRLVAVKPVVVLAYMRQQLELLRKIITVEGDVYLQMDGTGALCFIHWGNHTRKNRVSFTQSLKGQ